MIDQSSLKIWGHQAPWLEDSYVEQDLIISKALVEIFNHPLLAKQLAFRGGTALQKLFYKVPTRYSEDIDLVQTASGPIGPVFDGFREVLESWLGKPNTKVGPGRATLIYKFLSINNIKMRLKVEINTREHGSAFPLIEVLHKVESPWYTGEASIVSYSIEELLGTKLRALFQRKKGRDLYDMAIALRQIPLDVNKIIDCFLHYLNITHHKISRAEFEMNLWAKKENALFREDMIPLLAGNSKHDFEEDFNLVLENIVAKLPGEPWVGRKESGDEHG